MRNTLAVFCVVMLLLVLTISCENKKEVISVKEIRCENRINPIGIDFLHPRLSWKLGSSFRNKNQSAFRIIVSDSLHLIYQDVGNFWDTKKTESSKSIQIQYEGKKLSSEKEYFWKVKVWDENDYGSEWSEIGQWEMGLLEESDWKAKWINDGKTIPKKLEEFYEDDPAPLFRKDFMVKQKITKARLYISGLGYYEAKINGSKVGDCFLDPGWTNYSKQVLYSTFDVTELIKDEGNCLSVMLGNGWYNPLPMKMWGYLNLREHLPIGRPRFIAQLKLQYENGNTETIVSNNKWKTHEGPIRRNNIYLGEIYDARKEIKLWDSYNFNDSTWRFADFATEKIGSLKSQNQPKIKITASINPIKLSEPKLNVYVYDMGQNFTGWVKLKLKAKEGTKIKLKYGELLYEDGSLNGMTSVAGQIKGRIKNGESRGGLYAPDTAWQSDTYIAKGIGIESYTPKFTFHAFRYVEITGLQEKPSLDAIEGFRLNSDISKVGSFECSNELFNNIQKITEWTFLSNVLSVQSDCPHRERFGYGGDIVSSSDAFIYNYDMSNFYTKVVQDFNDAVLLDGRLTDTAPFVGIDYCGIGWAMAHPLLLSELYNYYGDTSIVYKNYEVARNWFENVISTNDLIMTTGLNDHETLAPNPTSELVTPIYYQCSVLMSDLAKIVNRKEDFTKYKVLSERIQDAYLENFLEKGNGRFAPNTQASQAFALYTGIAPEKEKENAILELINRINGNDGNLSTGIYGTKYMMDVLSENGYAEIISKMVNKKSFPGWGYMIENGATTLWEHWEYSDNTYSHNHPMFGSISEWFYKWIAGIQQDSYSIGFKNILVKPQFVSNVSWVKSKYKSLYGEIASEWKKNKTEISLKVSIPVNSSAKVYIPAISSDSVSESGIKISNLSSIKSSKMEGSNLVIEVGSGDYLFKSILTE